MSRTNSILSRFPDFYRSGDTDNLLHEFIGTFGTMLDLAEEDLIRVMKAHWVRTADNEGSKGFDAVQKGDLDKIFALYLESLGGTILLKQGTRREGTEGLEDDAIYRTRILGLIKVLREGASTIQGITDIVAANLGVLPDLPFADEAKKQIQIIEYSPEATNLGNNYEVTLLESFEVENDSDLPVIPTIRIVFKDLPVPLANPCIELIGANEFISYGGSATKAGEDSSTNNEVVKSFDVIYFLSKDKGLYEGNPFTPTGSGIFLPPGKSQLRFTAKIGLPEGNFDQSLFDFSQYDEAALRSIGRFDKTHFGDSIFQYDNPLADISITFQKLTPASFTVRIPWDIPGFTTTIHLTQDTLERLAIFELPDGILQVLQPFKNKEFETIAAFYEILDNPTTGILKDFDPALPERETYKRLILQECVFPDKFARFNINPRDQIKTIVNKVKAAGVYVEIDYEKRFFERHHLGEQLHLQPMFSEEPHDIEENFDIIGEQNPASIQHELSEHLIAPATGVFGFTSFDSLNTFGD